MMSPDPATEAAPPASTWLKPKLEGWANEMYLRFGGAKVYLVGSSLTKAEPRDVDVCIVMTDTAMRRRYGLDEHGLRAGVTYPLLDVGDKAQWFPSAGNWPVGRILWAKELAKLANDVQISYGLRLDLKLLSESEVDQIHAPFGEPKPRIRLDAMGDP